LRGRQVKKVCIINGPNLNLLGTREPEIYGTTTIKQIVRMVKRHAAKKGVRVRSFQSNSEGKLIDKIHSLAARGYEGIILNPGAYTHYSYALRDAISATGLKTVEVHLTDIEAREEFRAVSVIRDVCMGQIKGLGPEGYVRALDLLLSG